MMDLFSEIEEPEREELRNLRKELEEQNYKYYVRTGREMLGLPPVSEEGWARMAF